MKPMADTMTACCNTHTHTQKGWGEEGQGEERQAAGTLVPNVTAGVAVAQEADVLVGLHGANNANAWFMRRGSSMVELIPYQWDDTPQALAYSAFNAAVCSHVPTALLTSCCSTNQYMPMQCCALHERCKLGMP